MLGNVTFVQARQNYLAANGTVQAVADLENMSRTSWNATLYYDDSVFQIRGSAAFRSKYLEAVNPGNNNDLRLVKGSLNFDASASYKINENFTITAQGINLSNEPVISYLTPSASASTTAAGAAANSIWVFGIRTQNNSP